ncbi:hypothetical protein BMS3Abin07_00557 [bacterium BMS3Abin07]|nr:hypothetical protein BMS3Abin07_00557 [bacterium BMS3Abin07]GBE32841.1 hypothetical protein BMS3Bbin05_01769 [bacterium BMS3Bbin05]
MQNKPRRHNKKLTSLQAGKLNGSVAEKEKAYLATDLRGLRKG